MGIWKPPKIWDGSECWIIGGGPSILNQFGVPADVAEQIKNRHMPLETLSPYMRKIHGRHCIGINSAYMIGNWIDVLFFGDSSWYLHHKQPLMAFPGIKVSCAPRFANLPEHNTPDRIFFMQKDTSKRQGISQRPGHVAWNQNSGAASISLAVQFGAKRIILLGFDMSLDQDGSSHWFGYHREIKGSPENRKGTKRQLRHVNPPFSRHLRGFPAIAEDAKKIGIEILNASPDSKIDVFKKVKVKDIL